MNGWIKLYRQLQEHWIWKVKEPYDKRSAWQYILLQAFFKDDKTVWKGSLIDVKRGQFPTSIRTLSELWMWSNGKVNRFIDKLKSEQMIKTERIENGTLVTVVNYELYQGSCNSDGTPIDTPIDTPTEHQRDSDGTLAEHQRNTNETATEHNIRSKEDKETKEDKEGKEQKKDTHLSERKQIIEYLNQKSGTRYRHGSDINKKYINARLNEGYTVDDFYEVIDKKCGEWQGTEREKYLRPETLFGNKFESYLNQKIVKEKGQTAQMLEQHYSMVDDWVRRKEMEAESNEF